MIGLELIGRELGLCPRVRAAVQVKARGLEWWLATLRRGVAERRVPTRPTADPPVLMWTDARAVPPRLAAVVLMRGRWTYTDAAPPAELMGCARPARA